MSEKKAMEPESMVVGGKTILVKNIVLDQSILNFYTKNPRVYNVLNENDKEPSQSQIEEYMCKSEHVKQLKQTIQSNGGLIDPIIVKDGDFTVLEGNSRLAAYRLLCKSDPVRWGKIKCKLLPQDIDDKSIFMLLGQYHVIGRKDWDPFEQADYLFRRIQVTDQTVEEIAGELGLSKQRVEKMVEVIRFMREHDDLTKSNWSYYDEYLKDRAIKKYRETSPDIDDAIVNQIKSKEIKQAQDIRKLGKIAKQTDKSSKKIMKDIVDGHLDIYTAYKRIEETGKFDNSYVKLKKFHDEIMKKEFQDQLIQNAISDAEKNQFPVDFQLSKIIRILERIRKQLPKKHGNV